MGKVVVAGIYIHFLACNTILNDLEQVHFYQLNLATADATVSNPLSDWYKLSR